MNKKKVLFVCIHNSARSQMAEAFLNQMAGESFIAESAGMEPGRLNPIVVEAMQEIGIDISKNMTNSVDAYLNEGRRYDYVITVCDEASAQRCPLFPGGEKIHMAFPDPSQLRGDDKEIWEQTKKIRDEVKTKLEEWICEVDV